LAGFSAVAAGGERRLRLDLEEDAAAALCVGMAGGETSVVFANTASFTAAL